MSKHSITATSEIEETLAMGRDELQLVNEFKPRKTLRGTFESGRPIYQWRLEYRPLTSPCYEASRHYKAVVSNKRVT
jgi:hypothetical protein